MAAGCDDGRPTDFLADDDGYGLAVSEESVDGSQAGQFAAFERDSPGFSDLHQHPRRGRAIHTEQDVLQ